MCRKPTFIWRQEAADVWIKQPVPCRKCWQCKANYVSDYVGRSMCEAAYSDWTTVLCLTYAPRDDGADKILTPHHFQNFIRSLRRGGHKIRYLVAGEYGDLKGRAHFHVILFGKGPKPVIPPNYKFAGQHWPHETRFWLPSWPHGHIFAQVDVGERGVRYVCKYLLKNEVGKLWFSVSKKPLLGWDFFKEKAQMAADLDVLPSSFTYMPPAGNREKRYLMTGATKRDYLADVVKAYRAKRPLYAERLSENIAKAVQKLDEKAAQDFKDQQPLIVQLKEFLDELDEKRPSSRQVNRALLHGLDAGQQWEG